MSIINTHDITLHGSVGEYRIELRPLRDDHLPLLYQWNADPEVVYWSDTGNVVAFEAQDVRDIYGDASKTAHCFLIEVNGAPVGDMWLQSMNMPEVSAKYPGQDVRRIDIEIGEKALWGRGIGSAAFGLLIDFAFCGEGVDVLYCFAADYNVRSQRMQLRHGFQPCGESDAEEGSLRAKKEYHYSLTRPEYMRRCLEGSGGKDL